MGNEHFSFCDDSSGSCSMPQSTDTHLSKKPLELYIFMDPLCPECWAFEPVLKKLLIEYGHYFTPKLLLTSNIECWSEEKQKHGSMTFPRSYLQLPQTKTWVSKKFWNSFWEVLGLCFGGFG